SGHDNYLAIDVMVFIIVFFTACVAMRRDDASTQACNRQDGIAQNTPSCVLSNASAMPRLMLSPLTAPFAMVAKQSSNPIMVPNNPNKGSALIKTVENR
ncbi:MAG: hypothetical protein P8104_05950, partial [Gammaproteobacteria bacterium]